MHSPLPDPRPGEPEPYESPAEVAGDLNVSLLGVVEPLDPELPPPFALPELVDPGSRYDAIVDRVELLSGQMPVRLLGCLGLENDPVRYRLAANLAARLARGGRRITLVEAEFGRSMLAGQSSDRDGFIDMLLYGCSFQAVARPSGIAGVQVITAGSHPWSGEPIAGDEWERVLGAFRNNSDLTLLTASTTIPAPLLSMMARRLDWILIAFALDRGSRHAIRCSYLTLWDMDAPILGLVAETGRAAVLSDDRSGERAAPSGGRVAASSGPVAGSGGGPGSGGGSAVAPHPGDFAGIREEDVEPILDEIGSGEVVVRRGREEPRGPEAAGNVLDWGRALLGSDPPASTSGLPASTASSPGSGAPPAWEAALSGADRTPPAWDPFGPEAEADAEVVIREAREFESSAAELWQEEVARLRPAEPPGTTAARGLGFGTEAVEDSAEPAADSPTESETEAEDRAFGRPVESFPSHDAPDVLSAGEDTEVETERSFESAWESAMGASSAVETPHDRDEFPLPTISSVGAPPLLHAPGWPGVEETEAERPEESVSLEAELEGAKFEAAERERAERERAESERVERDRAEPELVNEEIPEYELTEHELVSHEPAPEEGGTSGRLELGRAELDRAEFERVTRDRAERERTERERADRERAEREEADEQVGEPLEPDWPPGIAPPTPVAARGGEVRNAIEELEKELIGVHTRDLVAKEPNRAPWRVLVAGAIVGILALLFWAYQNDIIRFEPKPPHPSESASARPSPPVEAPPAQNPSGEHPASQAPSGSKPGTQSSPPAVSPETPAGSKTTPSNPPAPSQSEAPSVAPPPAVSPSQPNEGAPENGGPGAGTRPSGFGVQVSSFETDARAKEDLTRYQAIGYKGLIITVQIPGKGERRRVILGPYPTLEEASSVAAAIREDGLSPQAQAVPLGR